MCTLYLYRNGVFRGTSHCRNCGYPKDVACRKVWVREVWLTDVNEDEDENEDFDYDEDCKDVVVEWE